MKAGDEKYEVWGKWNVANKGRKKKKKIREKQIRLSRGGGQRKITEQGRLIKGHARGEMKAGDENY